MVNTKRKSKAVISRDGKYRYSLYRDSGVVGGNSVVFIMVNPSTADAVNDDATIRKILGFSVRNCFSNITVVNLFAYRSKNIKDLSKLHIYDAVGKDNYKYVVDAFKTADIAVVCWGSMNKLPTHLRTSYTNIIRIAEMTNHKLYCFKQLKDGHPAHPLMLSYSNHLKLWDTSKIKNIIN